MTKEKPVEKKQTTRQPFWRRLLELLRRFIRKIFASFTDCFGAAQDGEEVEDSEMKETKKSLRSRLSQPQQEAVDRLIRCLETESRTPDNGLPCVSREMDQCLTTLVNSGMSELQHCAALCYVELSDTVESGFSRLQLLPLVKLLHSTDLRVLNMSLTALNNLFVYSPADNRGSAVDAGVLQPLIHLLWFKNDAVRAQACDCLTSLAVTDRVRGEMLSLCILDPLLPLCRTDNKELLKGVTGVLLNLSHSERARRILSAVSTTQLLLGCLQRSKDEVVLYQTSAVLTNLSSSSPSRDRLMRLGPEAVVRVLVPLLSRQQARVSFQACLTLRNLSTAVHVQPIVVRAGALPVLLWRMNRSTGSGLAAACALLRNLSLHPSNELPLLRAGFVTLLKEIVLDPSSPEAQRHAAATLRNLAVSCHSEIVIESGMLGSLAAVLKDSTASHRTQAEAVAGLTALIAVANPAVACDGVAFASLVHGAAYGHSDAVRFSCAAAVWHSVNKYPVSSIRYELLHTCSDSLVRYCEVLLRAAKDNTTQEIVIGTLSRLITESAVHERAMHSDLLELVDQLARDTSLPQRILQLVNDVQRALCTVNTV